MELYQRVWAEQFTLTDEDKAAIMRNEKVYWQDAYVRQNGPTRFHVLLHIVDQEKPVYENQWLVKVGGQTMILWDHEVKSRFLIALPQTVEENPQPIQSEALRRFLENNKKKEVQPGEPEQRSSLLDEFMQKGTIMQPAPEIAAEPTDLKEVDPGELTGGKEVNGTSFASPETSEPTAQETAAE
jgi:hypothetical protein